jgi:hypothetical protein
MAASPDRMAPRSGRGVALTPHPLTPTDVVQAIEARLHRYRGGALAVKYTLTGHLERVRIPEPRPPRVADGLWQHTCCELFVRRAGAAAYHEFNFAPSAEWAGYTFEDYRKGARLLDASFDPRIVARVGPDLLELEAVIALDRLSPLLAHAPLAVSITAIVEDRDGVLSYWALEHPADRPDFHHRDAFVLELDEIRN